MGTRAKWPPISFRNCGGEQRGNHSDMSSRSVASHIYDQINEMEFAEAVVMLREYYGPNDYKFKSVLTCLSMRFQVDMRRFCVIPGVLSCQHAVEEAQQLEAPTTAYLMMRDLDSKSA